MIQRLTPSKACKNTPSGCIWKMTAVFGLLWLKGPFKHCAKVEPLFSFISTSHKNFLASYAYINHIDVDLQGIGARWAELSYTHLCNDKNTQCRTRNIAVNLSTGDLCKELNRRQNHESVNKMTIIIYLCSLEKHAQANHNRIASRCLCTHQHRRVPQLKDINLYLQ